GQREDFMEVHQHVTQQEVRKLAAVQDVKIAELPLASILPLRILLECRVLCQLLLEEEPTEHHITDFAVTTCPYGQIAGLCQDDRVDCFDRDLVLARCVEDLRRDDKSGTPEQHVALLEFVPRDD